jgi:hypothetical protein
MKRILFTALLFSGFTASAQQPDTTGDGRLKYGNILQRSLLPKAKYSHTTSKGKVYILPYDNMPCLVPDMKQVRPMPGSKMPEGNMPNALPRLQVIPKSKNEDHR